MTEHEKRIREALEAGPTDGPWASEVDDTNLNEINIISNNRPYVATAWPADASNDREQESNAAYIAACSPSAIRALLADLDNERRENNLRKDLVASGNELVNKLNADLDAMRGALKFYADGNHFVRADADAWETVSGEPPNFWEDEANTATVEDGTVARAALKGASHE